jgi:hypothetical protein
MKPGIYESRKLLQNRAEKLINEDSWFPHFLASLGIGDYK